MKKLLVFALLISCSSLGIVFANGSNAAASGTNGAPVSIGFAVYGMSGWVSSGYDGVKAVAKADNVDLHWASANFSVAQQVAQVRQFITENVKAIIIDPVDSSALGPEIKEAVSRGIKVFGTNVKIYKPGSEYLTSYIGPDDVLAGENETKALVKALDGKGNVVILEGPLGQSAQIDRTQGINNILAKYPGIKVLAKQPAQWSRVNAYKLMQSWISAFGSKINGVISQNDDMAVGVVRALKERNMANIPVVGIDGIKSGLLAVKAGEQLVTNLQDAPLQLGMALQVAVDSLAGKQVPKTIYIHMPVVTKANVDRIYKQMYADRKQFIAGIPALIKANLASGQYGNQ